MRIGNLHPWDLTPGEAMALQVELAPQVITVGEPREVRLVAGCDIAFADRAMGRQPGVARAAVALLTWPGLDLVESHVLECPVSFRYVPGLLAFREAPALVQVLERLNQIPDLLLADGHGYSHPRRFGIACHLGLLAGVPTIGIAKTRLTGEADTPAAEPGAGSDLRSGGEVIGRVLRTRPGARPVFVSVGHRISLQAASEWALRLCRLDSLGQPAYRLPEPVRLADKLSKGQTLQRRV